MKVCIFMALFERGGIDSYWRLVMSGAPGIKWQIFTNTDCAASFDTFDKEDTDDREKVMIERGIVWKKPIQTSRAFKAYLDREKPDAVILNGTLAEVLILPLWWLLKKRGIRILNVYHNRVLYPSAWKNLVNRLSLSLLGWLHDTNFFVSRAVAQYWLCRGIVNPLPIRAVRRELREAPREICLGFVGRLSWEKGPDLFCELLQKIWSEPLHSEVRLVAKVFGDGPMMSSMKDSLQEHSDRVAFEGWVSPIEPHLASIDLLVMTSRSEGFPMTVIECLKAGVPVLSFDVGGIGEALGDLSKEALSPPLAVDDLARRITRFCEDYEGSYQNYFDQLMTSDPRAYYQTLAAAVSS